MKIKYNKNEIIAAARFLLENKPSSRIPSDIPNTDRGHQAERGQVGNILDSIRALAKENAKVFEAIQKSKSAADGNADKLWGKWVEVMGIGGYWLIADIEGDAINFAVAVSPYYGEYVCTTEEI